jgi:Protein of unknwon function (DUF3310)
MNEDFINQPKHYTSIPAKCECGRPIECIQVTEHLGFNIGNAIKYLWRCDYKGNALEDLYKASWYIQREIGRRERKKINDSSVDDPRISSEKERELLVEANREFNTIPIEKRREIMLQQTRSVNKNLYSLYKATTHPKETDYV